MSSIQHHHEEVDSRCHICKQGKSLDNKELSGGANENRTRLSDVTGRRTNRYTIAPCT